jgi:uncharacterized protein
MKLRLTLLALLASVALRAADSLPLFNATLTVGKDHRFVLVSPGGKTSGFLTVGESFEGFRLKSYDPKTGVLEVERDGRVSPLTLVADASVKNAPAMPTQATLADAEAVLKAMNFEVIMDKTLEGMRKSQAAMVEQMMGRNLPPQTDPQRRTEIVEFQKKILDEMMSGLKADEMKQDIAKAYSEIFTKEELQGLGAFYQSSAGKAFAEKQPQLTERMNAVMTPRIMEAMPRVQQMARDFQAQQKAKREGAAPMPSPKQ